MPGCCIRVLVLMPGSFLRFATLCNSTISARCPIKQNSFAKDENKFCQPGGPLDTSNASAADDDADSDIRSRLSSFLASADPPLLPIRYCASRGAPTQGESGKPQHLLSVSGCAWVLSFSWHFSCSGWETRFQGAHVQVGTLSVVQPFIVKRACYSCANPSQLEECSVISHDTRFTCPTSSLYFRPEDDFYDVCVTTHDPNGPVWLQYTGRGLQWVTFVLSWAQLAFYGYQSLRTTLGWEETYVCVIEGRMLLLVLSVDCWELCCGSGKQLSICIRMYPRPCCVIPTP